MSISRLLHEFRPLFRMLEDPLMRAPVAYGFPRSSASLFSEPFTPPSAIHPALDLIEEGDKYIVEAELPGIKKDNVDITVGDSGRCIIIHGKTHGRHLAEISEPAAQAVEGSVSHGEGAGAVEVTSQKPTNQLAAERLYSGSSTFTRTVWLPQPIDSSKVSAKLVDGVLTLKAPKMEDRESIKINVD